MRRPGTFARLGTASWVRVTAVAVAMLAVSLLVVQRSTSAFSGTTGNSGNSLSTGTVVLSDDDSDTALFTVSNMTANQEVTKCITVTYTGTSPAAEVKLYGTSANSTLSPYLDLVVTRGVVGSSCASPGGVTPTAMFNTTTPATSAGTLEAFTTNHGTHATGVGAGWIPVSGNTRPYNITFKVKDHNDAQGKTATPAFTWEVRSS